MNSSHLVNKLLWFLIVIDFWSYLCVMFRLMNERLFHFGTLTVACTVCTSLIVVKYVFPSPKEVSVSILLLEHMLLILA